MTKVIGLTGGIGSGKSTVANQFKNLGVPIYIADNAAKEIMESPEIINSIVEHFGTAILSDQKPDRRKLASIVFDNPVMLEKLNGIIHPAVRQHFSEWLLQQDYPIVIREAAILFESGSYKDCDAVITVTAPMEIRIERVMSRDGSTREQVVKRIQNQWTDAMRIAKSDFVIENIDLNQTERQINEIHQKLLKM